MRRSGLPRIYKAETGSPVSGGR